VDKLAQLSSGILGGGGSGSNVNTKAVQVCLKLEIPPLLIKRIVLSSVFYDETPKTG